MSAHRRLSGRVKTSATVVATGIGAAITVGAFANPAAAASADPPWKAVRQCESGGNYSTNTGNGYYGAYQFSLPTWRGLGMNGLPHQAPPAVQDQAARRLAGQHGMKPWPTCGKRYGGPAPSGGGRSHHVHSHPAPTPSSVGVPNRQTRATSSLQARSRHTRTQHTAASGLHKYQQSPQNQQSYRNHRSYRNHQGDHWTNRSHPSHQNQWTHRNHWRYASAAETGGAVRVLSIRLVGQARTDVRLYQLALDRVGYHLAVDGRFGRLTRLATVHFQAAHRLVVDGLAGTHTKAALVRALAEQH